jgi:hypothetical protein
MVGPLPIAASAVFTDTGAKFVEVAADPGYANPDVDAAGEILGWMEIGALTASSTKGGSTGQVDISPHSVYYIPANATVDQTMVGKTCDIAITSNVQSANVSGNTNNTLMIVGVDITNQAVFVRMNPEEIGQTSV